MRAALLLFVFALCSACGGSGGASEASGDERFGHRYPGVAPDGRETMLLTPADSVVRVLIYPAVLDSIAVRPERSATTPEAPVSVEVLLKGTLPDACSRLEDAIQMRRGHLIDVELTTRQPRGRACAQVIRPFRFYLPLEGTYGPGSYTLKVNGAPVSFRIRELAPEAP